MAKMTAEECFRIHRPYCLKQLNEKEYIFLNRKYKPIGTSSNEWVRYEDHPWMIRPFEYDIIEKYSYLFKNILMDKGLKIGFFYDDGSRPNKVTWAWLTKWDIKISPLYEVFPL